MSTGLLKIQEVLTVSTLGFHSGNVALLPSNTTMSYAASFRSCRTAKLGFIYGSRMTVLHHIFFLQFGSSWTTRLRPTARRARSPDLTPSDFYICGHQNVFVLQKAVTSTTCNKENRMCFRRFVLELSSESGDHRSDVQRHALKIKVDTLGIFFVFQRS